MTEFYLESQKTYNGRYMYLSCTQRPVPEENKSIVAWVLTVTGGESSYYTTGPTTITIDAQTVYYSPKVYYNAPKFPASKGSVSGEIEISHGADGTKTIECSIKTAIYNGVMQENKASWELDAIPQESTVLVSDCYIGSTAVVLVDRKSSGYTHTIGFCTPDLEGFLCADGTLSQEPVKLEATTIPFQVPTYLYDRIPDARKIECTFLCTTYSGDTQIGESQECTFFASCREEDCIPDVSGQVVDCNDVTIGLTGDETVLVRFFSRASCQIIAAGKNGATIQKLQINGREVTGNQVELPNVETGVFTFSATDSRGYQGSYTLERELIPYRKLTANCAVRRESPTSDKVTLTVTGEYWAEDFGGKANTLRAICRVGEAEIPLEVSYGESGYTATAELEGLAYDKASTLSVTVEDALIGHTLSVTVKPGVPVFDWGEKDFAFHVPVTLSDGSEAISKNQLMSLLQSLGLIE